MLTAEASMWIFQLNLICSLWDTSRLLSLLCIWRSYCEQCEPSIWMLWLLCSYVCVNGPFSCSPGEPPRSPYKGGSPCWRLLVILVALCECECFCVRFQFCSILCKEPPDHAVPVRVFYSLSEYWPLLCISVLWPSFANCSCFAGASVNQGQYQYFL